MTFFCQKICTCQKKAVLLHPLSKNSRLEHLTVNQGVLGSSPRGSAKASTQVVGAFFFALFARRRAIATPSLKNAAKVQKILHICKFYV